MRSIRTIFKGLALSAAAIGTTIAITDDASAKVSYPSDVVYDQAAAGNFRTGRSGGHIDSLAIHTTEGSYGSAVNWFNNPASGVSAHYVISKDGDITQMVDSWDTAYTTNYYNSRSISFEMAGYAGEASTWYYQPWEPEYGTTYKNYRPNLDALANLAAFFMERTTSHGVTYDIPNTRSENKAKYHWSNGTRIVDEYLDEEGWVGHDQVTPWYKTDPGEFFPWEDVMMMTQSYLDNGENIYWPTVTIPEPTTMATLAFGLPTLLLRRKRAA
ncbi:N-acetylmuramoyl-L-alanine amidase [Poriferisphaera sp. WC338]|uniref:N-acetylmuramoyl-L-alanine amidase n=1 Tax=Poriferisphaera sp. WC338 TaxID=3425129 RepID=UPI003D81A97E